MNDILKSALFDLKQILQDNGGEFIFIGAVAANLLGADFDTKDIDICGSSQDVEKLKINHNFVDNTLKSVSHIKSSPFIRIPTKYGIDYEFMGDIKIKKNEIWIGLDFGNIIEIDGFKIPDFESQLSILRQFGRSKDLQKLDLLQSMAKEGKINVI